MLTKLYLLIESFNKVHDATVGQHENKWDLTLHAYKLCHEHSNLMGLFVTSWEGHKLWVFENRMLRKVFSHKRVTVTADWRRVHNEEHRHLILTKHHSGDQMNKNEMGGSCGTYGTGAYRILVGKAEGKRSLGCLRHRWKVNIKMELKT